MHVMAKVPPFCFPQFCKAIIDIVRLLLENGAEADIVAVEPTVSILTEKPLDLAQQLRFLINWEKYRPIVRLLEKFGARDFNGQPDFTEEELNKVKEMAQKQNLGNRSKDFHEES